MKNGLIVTKLEVAPPWQSQKIATRLLNDAIEKAKSRGFKTLAIGTGNSSVGQLYLNQKAGFRITEVKRNFFRENYKDPIFENGVECVDLIMLTMQL